MIAEPYLWAAGMDTADIYLRWRTLIENTRGLPALVKSVRIPQQSGQAPIAHDKRGVPKVASALLFIRSVLSILKALRAAVVPRYSPPAYVAPHDASSILHSSG